MGKITNWNVQAAKKTNGAGGRQRRRQHQGEKSPKKRRKEREKEGKWQGGALGSTEKGSRKKRKHENWGKRITPYTRPSAIGGKGGDEKKKKGCLTR